MGEWCVLYIIEDSSLENEDSSLENEDSALEKGPETAKITGDATFYEGGDRFPGEYLGRGYPDIDYFTWCAAL